MISRPRVYEKTTISERADHGKFMRSKDAQCNTEESL